MKNLRFHELLLCSEKEKAARRIPFHRQVTIIKGQNDHGKSCLIKSLYTALGATTSMHPKWKNLNVTLLLRFMIDEDAYVILKIGGRYALFDGHDNVIGTYSSVTTELGPQFAEMLDFHLQLTNNKTNLPEQATPACLFVPFYMDQDKSWTDNWDSFEYLKQFRDHRTSLSLFHTGIRPNEYYIAQARKIDAEQRLNELKGERSTVKRVLDKIELLLAQSQFDIDIASYQNEIERLLAECNELRADEEALKQQMVHWDNRKAHLLEQIRITEAATDELDKDFVFATTELPENVECPICGAAYHNDFLEQFNIARDEDRLRELTSEMKDEVDECNKEIQNRAREVSRLEVRAAEITSLLEVQQGEVHLRDVLQNEGKKEVRSVLRTEWNNLNQKIGATDAERDDAEDEMKEFTKAKHTQKIRSFYRELMTNFLHELHVTELDEDSYKDVHSKIRETGSALPRALLAFYFAILHTIHKFSKSALCPIVIDSPKQQDMDDGNWMRELEFIRDHQPPESQLILAVVDDGDVDFGGDVIELVDEKQLLQKDEYTSVARILRGYIEASLAH